MKYIDAESIKEPLNKCYDNFDPNWQRNHRLNAEIDTSENPRGFKKYLERDAGIILNFQVKQGKTGGFYSIDSIQLINEQQYTMWLLKWA